ncbi:MAG TPA: hypothetical protein DCZ91_15475, partial [Lachnospiraceae bacterium]|nr:hypothetical protein [Lachnospiraceae bacterium]
LFQQKIYNGINENKLSNRFQKPQQLPAGGGRSKKLIDRYNIPLDEYPRRCVNQIAGWEKEKNDILNDGRVTHERSHYKSASEG